MDHAWLDSLSEDWVSQPPSDPSPRILPPAKSAENEPTNAKTPGSRIPRAKTGAKSCATTEDDSIGILGERSQSEINIPSSLRGPSKSSLETANSGRNGRYVSRSVSVATTGSVVHNTMQHHTTANGSRQPSSGEVPEWKRRLVYGDLAYGEQRDLFCSAGTGLEDMFKPPLPKGAESAPKSTYDPEETLPSSPPFYSVRRVEDDDDDEWRGMHDNEDEVMDPTPSPSPGRKSREIRYRVVDDSQDAGEMSYLQDKGTLPQLSQNIKNEQGASENSQIIGNDPGRKASSQSVVRNEVFSPIYLSPKKAEDGRVDFAPVELAPAQLRAKLENLHTQQMLLNSQFDGYQEDALPHQEPADAINTTDDYVQAGGFINVRRGGRSAEGSFRHRLLSPSLVNDTSEMLPEESLQASTPKQFPSVRTNSPLPSVDRSPPAIRAPHPSPQKQSTSTAATGGSPLKLFGPYDTFTNQTLMRRISQFEDQMSGSPSRQSLGSVRGDSSGLSDESPDARNQAKRKVSTFPLSRRTSRFGVGELDHFEFQSDVSATLEGRSQDQDTREQDSNPASTHESPPGDRQCQSPPEEEDLFVRRRRQGLNSSAANPPSTKTDSRPTSRHQPLATPKRRDTGSDGKRPRTSPSKDPTPKRRRTLHKSDIAYGREGEAVIMDSVQTTHLHMQAIMSKKRKDARPGEAQQLANPDVLAARQMLRPRTPTPSQRSSLQRENGPPVPEIDAGPTHNLLRRSPNRGAPPASSSSMDSSFASQTERKPSIKTQDFLDEAGKIMAMIRNQVRPQTGLASVEESEAEHILSGGDTLDDSFQESTKEPFSRPPSREGRAVPRVPNRQDDPELVKHLKKYQELSDMGDIITSSIRSMSLAKDAIRAAQEIERQVDAGTKRRSYLTDLANDDVFSDPPNIRITENPDLQGRDPPQVDHLSQSSGSSTNRSIPTGSSRGSESKRTIAPQSVSHLIPDQVGSMYLDRGRNVWVKKKEVAPPRPSLPPSEDSEDDPFASIPDLSVDLTQEMRNLHLRRVAEEQLQGGPGDEHTPTSSPAKSPSRRSARRYDTLSPDAGLDSDMAARARDELAKLETKAGEDNENDTEDVELEITINEGRDKGSSPSRRRNLTISFSSPIASIIQDAVRDDVSGMEEDGSNAGMEFAERPSGFPGRRASSSAHSTSKPGQRSQSIGARGPGRSSLRHTSLGGISFVPRPVSRIDERDEQSQVETEAEESDRQVSIVGHHSALEQATPDHRRTSLSFIVRPSAGDDAGNASAIIGQNVGNLSLSPLSEFTVLHSDQSFGLEVSYIVGDRHLVSGDGSKRVMSVTIRDLVDRLSEVEPFEPHWEDFQALDLHDKRLSSLHMLDEFCGKLVTLDASSNSLGHLDGVPSSVRELRVTNNLLSELTSWDHLMNLQYLDVSNNDIRSLSALRHLVHLRSVRADNNLITSLDGLADHDALLSLRARNNLIEAIDLERGMLRRLTELDLGGNQITSIGGLDQLESLSTLKLPRNRLASFALDGACEALRYLDLSDNQVQALDLSKMAGLRLLHADRNQIWKVTGFSTARHLDSLSLREQQSDKPLDLSFLAAAYEIRKLFLSGNYLGRFEPKVDFLNLQLLELANCGLEGLPENVGQLMPNLRTLNLNFNAISDLTPLRFIPRMKKLLVAGNRLADSTTMTELLTEFPHLTQLDLRDNGMTLGFYAPLQTLVKTDGSTSTDPFSLPDADSERDQQFASRLDEGTKLRRRLHHIVFAACCKRLRKLDGLTVDRATTLARDSVFDRLVEEGLVPDDVAQPEMTETADVGNAN